MRKLLALILTLVIVGIPVTAYADYNVPIVGIDGGNINIDTGNPVDEGDNGYNARATENPNTNGADKAYDIDHNIPPRDRENATVDFGSEGREWIYNERGELFGRAGESDLQWGGPGATYYLSDDPLHERPEPPEEPEPIVTTPTIPVEPVTPVEIVSEDPGDTSTNDYTGAASEDYVNNAIQNAINQNSNNATLTDVSLVYQNQLRGALQQLNSQTTDSGQAALHFNSTSNGKLDGTITVRNGDVNSLPDYVDFSLTTTGDYVDSLVRRYEGMTGSTAAAVQFGQNGYFGARLEVTLNVDLTGMDINNLSFFNYDQNTNTYSRVGIPYTFNSNGRLVLMTTVGKDLIITG